MYSLTVSVWTEQTCALRGNTAQRTDRTLRSPGVQLIHHPLQIVFGGRPAETLRGAPEQGGTAQIHQRAVLQLTGLVLHLMDTHRDRHTQRQHSAQTQTHTQVHHLPGLILHLTDKAQKMQTGRDKSDGVQ